MRVAIVIVTYNSAAHIAGCLDSLRAFPAAEIVVVDNASGDATRTVVSASGTRLIANARNAGFAAAVNQGIRATSSPFVLLLNPDARVLRGIDALRRDLEDPQTGAAGGLLQGADGRPQAGFMARSLPTAAALICEVLGVNRWWFSNPVNWHYRCLSLNPVTPCIVEQPAGAFLMFTRRTWERVGGFDERFWPLWFEDVDFCAKLKASGLTAKYNPAAVAIHAGGHSIGSLSVANRERYWYGSLLEYAAKYYTPLAFRAVCAAVMLGSALRAAVYFPDRGFKVFAVYGAVCRFAASRLLSRRGSRAVAVVR